MSKTETELTNLINNINDVLPQTQCTKCGYDGCKPYAAAIANNQALINRCPPGGDDGIAKLAQLLNKDIIPLDTECGIHKPLEVAIIHEEHCIGCTLCIQACPVDAILGANKLMHTILYDQCTGCELCVEPCPVDCIEMVAANRDWTTQDAVAAKENYENRNQRLSQVMPNAESGAIARTLSNKANLSAAAFSDDKERSNTIQDVLARARARRRNS